MRLVAKSEWFMFGEGFEDEVESFLGSFIIERKEVNGRISWYGEKRHYVKEPNSKNWCAIEDDKMYHCDEPKFEKKRRELEMRIIVN
jgi:hypothetical protein